MTFNVGAEVNLLCEIKNLRLFASAKWIREETKQILRTKNFSFVDNFFFRHRFSHVIDEVSTNDAGYYTCFVTFDGHGSRHVSYKLQVKGKWFLSRTSVFNFARLSFFWFYLRLQAYLFCSSRLHVWLPSSTTQCNPPFPICAISLSITFLFSWCVILFISRSFHFSSSFIQQQQQHFLFHPIIYKK